MSEQLFTSDWHLGHVNIMKKEYCDRPFETVEEMAEVFFHNLEAMWSRGDTLYFLGDMSLNNYVVARMLDRMFRADIRNIIYIFGNHDHSNTLRNKVAKHKSVHWCGDLKTIKLFHGCEKHQNPYPAFLCHYPMRSWNMSVHGARHLHGHSHGDMPEYFNSLDVGIDNAKKLLGDYRPFTAREVYDEIERINEDIDEEIKSAALHHGRT